MYKSPDLPAPRIERVYSSEMIELWLRALERPEIDMRVKVADTIVLAKRRGMKGLEATVGPLRTALDRADQPAIARLALAHTLVALEARDTAPSLLQQAQAGPSDLRNLIEPALARWDYKPARAVWLERLKPLVGSGGDRTTAPKSAIEQRRDIVLAIQGLAVVRESEAVEPLRALALNESAPGPLRVEAARALGSLRSDGLEKHAARLVAGASREKADRLIAAFLVRRHQGPEAVRLLLALADDSEPAVAALALERLVEIDSQLAEPAVERHAKNADAVIRGLAVNVLFKRPSDKHVRLLADRLADRDPRVRAEARRSLLLLANDKKLREPVVAEALRMLAGDDWRALEQAVILFAQLDHKPAAKRCVELLTFPRAEVMITAAWGLRKLDVPETLPDALSYVEPRAKMLLSGKTPFGVRLPPGTYDHQLSQLNQFFGQQKYAAAEALLRRFIPKDPSFPEARAAAVWTLGLLLEGKTDDALATALEERLNEFFGMPPETTEVRYMSAITLGRLKAKAALPSLRNFFADGELTENPINNACGWAIAQITGEPLPPPRTRQIVMRGGWFLTPAK